MTVTNNRDYFSNGAIEQLRGGVADTNGMYSTTVSITMFSNYYHKTL